MRCNDSTMMHIHAKTHREKNNKNQQKRTFPHLCKLRVKKDPIYS